MAGPNQPGSPGHGARHDESLDAKPRRVALTLIYTAGRSSSVPQGGRAGQACLAVVEGGGDLGLGSRRQRMDGGPAEKNRTATT